jgi:hypothetical protein
MFPNVFFEKGLTASDDFLVVPAARKGKDEQIADFHGKRPPERWIEYSTGVCECSRIECGSRWYHGD